MNSRALSKCALTFEEETKKQLPWWCIGGIVSMATWQMERVTYIASKVCDKLDKRLQSA